MIHEKEPNFKYLAAIGVCAGLGLGALACAEAMRQSCVGEDGERYVSEDGLCRSTAAHPDAGPTAEDAGRASIQELVATDDAYVTDQGAALETDADTGLLANDLGEGALSAKAEVAQTAAGGEVSVRADGGFEYQAPDGFWGIDSFEYQVVDATGAELVATARVAVRLTKVALAVLANSAQGYALTSKGDDIKAQSMGDLDGDGLQDFAFGAPDSESLNGSKAGRVLVTYGSSARPQTSIIQRGAGDPSGIIAHGAGRNDSAGLAVSLEGDLNGDGFNDLVIGAPIGSVQLGGEEKSGLIYVIYGSATRPETAIDLKQVGASVPGFVLHDDESFSAAGAALSVPGDLNGDGIDDLVIGNPLTPGLTGAVYVVYGTKQLRKGSHNLVDVGSGIAGFRLEGSKGDQLGGDPCRAGDLDGDGIDDLVVGVPSADASVRAGSGSVDIIYGTRERSGTHKLSAVGSSLAGFRIDGAGENDRVGRVMHADADFDGDGFDDLAIGVAGSDANGEDSGRVRVMYGGPQRRWGVESLGAVGTRTAGLIVNGAVAGDRVGEALSAGDFNRDGLDDLAISADASGSHVYVIYGSEQRPIAPFNRTAVGLHVAGFVLHADAPGASPLLHAGDANGDGFDDLVVLGTETGPQQFYVLYGTPTSVPPQ